MSDKAKQQADAAQSGPGLGILSVTPKDSGAGGPPISSGPSGSSQGSSRGKDGKS
jgi:hypothetical protein